MDSLNQGWCHCGRSLQSVPAIAWSFIVCIGCFEFESDCHCKKRLRASSESEK